MEVSLLDLAKRFNLLTTVEAPPANVETRIDRKHKNGSRKTKGDPFKYFICLDFEATCWEKADQAKWKTQEIIEFPSVLVKVDTGDVEAEFQRYLKPVEFSTLTDFCVRLTGITQTTVNNGCAMKECLQDFDLWMQKICKERNLVLPKTNVDSAGMNVALCTWTDWDIITLSKECARKKLRKPPYFGQWIDVRKIFMRHYKIKPTSFNHAINHVGLKFVGKPHSGIDDARNLARLVTKMKKDGAKFSITKDTAPYQAVNKPVQEM
ncbi:3'-5' exonuclease Snipper [Culicoides brevitarsis]|uniref:3'-5' exonuclease Snipper n=1 Tax=Culicoides brevitarsis TaxID=469753 RepID=UPI00307B6320